MLKGTVSEECYQYTSSERNCFICILLSKLDTAWMYIHVNRLRIYNKVGFIIYEDLCLIDKGSYIQWRLKCSTWVYNRNNYPVIQDVQSMGRPCDYNHKKCMLRMLLSDGYQVYCFNLVPGHHLVSQQKKREGSKSIYLMFKISHKFSTSIRWG